MRNLTEDNEVNEGLPNFYAVPEFQLQSVLRFLRFLL